MKSYWIFATSLLLICQCGRFKASLPYEEFLTNNELAIKKRISEVRQFMLPLPEDQFVDILQQTAKRYFPIHAESEQCLNKSNYLLKSFLQGDMWALRMLDASSKLVPGVLDGHLQDLGNYEQCINIEEPGRTFRGQHCVILTTGLVPRTIQDEVPYLRQVTFSLCVPSSCSVEDVATHVDRSLAELNASTLYSVIKAATGESSLLTLICSTAEPLPYRTKDYIALSFYGAFAAVIIACTVLDSKYGISKYSLKRNFHALMDTTPPSSEISCMNGLRVIFIVLVVMYHRLGVMLLIEPTFRQRTVLDKYDSFTMLFLESLTSILEAFFMIGGTVLSYNFFRKKQYSQSFSVLHFYVHRYFRLTPVLAVIMLFYATLTIHISQGPIWAGEVTEMFEKPCTNYWWLGLLHISNYFTPGTMCVDQSWFVACDFQFHLLAPLFLITLHKSFTIGMALMAISCLVPIIAEIANSYVFKLYPWGIYNYYIAQHDTNGSSDVDYRGIHYRLDSFVIGLALGYALSRIKNNRDNIKLSKSFFVFGWATAAVFLMLIYVVTSIVKTPGHQWSPWIDPLFNGLSGPVFCACMAWVIFACSLGYGGVVNQFLSWSAFRPLSRLTFGVYLVHEIVVVKQEASVQVSLAFSYWDYYFLVCGDVMISFTVACVLYLFVEVPCSNIVTKLLKGKGGGKHFRNENRLPELTTVPKAKT